MSDWIQFDGDDNCEKFCLGWQPNNGNRCDCGNSRVNFNCLESKCNCSEEQMNTCYNAYANTY